MTEYTSIRVPIEAREIAQEAKHENETWADYIKRCAEEPKALMTEEDIEHIAAMKIQNMVVEEALR